MHGEGSFYYVNGDEYKGAFKNGTMHGQGRYTEANGDRYEGEWKDGVREGRGIRTFADGEFLVSRFAGDVSVGEAAICSADRQKAWQMRDGNLHDVVEISLERAEQIAAQIDKAL